MVAVLGGTALDAPAIPRTMADIATNKAPGFLGESQYVSYSGSAFNYDGALRVEVFKKSE